MTRHERFNLLWPILLAMIVAGRCKFADGPEAALVSISPSFSELAEIGARITAKIIESAGPRDIPVQ